MKIEPFHRADVAAFLKLADGEGWLAEPWEFEFLLAEFPEGCFCVRDQDGRGSAFVTTLRHEKSGWIGNLIVAPEVRGQGLGDALFRRAVEALRAAGVRTFWLTASDAGKALYEKYGFKSIDTVVRWSGTGRRRHGEPARQRGACGSSASVSSIDCQAWGDRRDALLAATIGRGELLLEETGFAVIQGEGASLQLGPFSALESASAEYLYDSAFDSVSSDRRIYLDAPLSNRAAVELFSRRGMRITGTTALMYAGDKPAYRSELLYGLATMGSCG